MSMASQRIRCNHVIALPGHSKPVKCDGTISSEYIELDLDGMKTITLLKTCNNCGQVDQELFQSFENRSSKSEDLNLEEVLQVLSYIKCQMHINGARESADIIDELTSEIKKPNNVSLNEALDRAFILMLEIDSSCH